MLDNDFIRRKLALNQKDLTRLEEFEDLTVNEIAQDPIKGAACERFLERIIGRAIDINQHVIAEKGDITLEVIRYRDTFLRMADLEVYSKEFAEQIAPSVGLRNALVHEYNNIDPNIFHKSIGEAIKEFNVYAKYVLDFIERQTPSV